jgi:hypothetical protein
MPLQPAADTSTRPVSGHRQMLATGDRLRRCSVSRRSIAPAGEIRWAIGPRAI